MKVVILCAGYATRLYPFTINEPKALLIVNGLPLLSYTIKNLEDIEEIDKIFIVTNEKFYNKFLEWKKQNKETNKIEIINDKTEKNEERLGGVIDLGLALKKIDDDILVVLGDNFFNFDFKKFIDFFNEKQSTCIALHDVEDKEKAKRFAVVEINEEGRVVSCREKPPEANSTLICTGCYIFTKSDIEKIQDYIKTGKNKEGPSYIIEDFVKQGQKVMGFTFDGSWYDIGTIEDYEEIKKEIEETRK